MFWIRYTDANGTPVEVPLDPAPTEVDYPETDAVKTLTTQDGAVILQRPLRDARARRWIWRGYGPRSEPYATQWALLESLTARKRRQDALPPTVGIWEDVSDAGGFGRRDGSGARQYTTVKVAQAHRVPRTGGGPVGYESVLEFYVEDPSFSAF